MTAGGQADLRPVTEDDWALWRDLRSRVLVTDPDAFGSTLEREQAFTESDWRARVGWRPSPGAWGSAAGCSSRCSTRLRPGREVLLWVADGNPARHLYTRAGLVDTGESAPLRPGSPVTKSRMALGGSRTRKVLPRPTSDSTSMRP